jgi:hemoglobin-like flavoprotein
MTPGQIELMEATMASLDLATLAVDFYERAFALEPALSAMFTTDPAVQQARFAAELAEILSSIRSLDTFASSAMALGARHRGYGVRATHYRLMGQALMASLANALRERWTPEVEEAWTLAYNLMAETMMTGAMEHPPSH